MSELFAWGFAHYDKHANTSLSGDQGYNNWGFWVLEFWFWHSWFKILNTKYLIFKIHEDVKCFSVKLNGF